MSPKRGISSPRGAAGKKRGRKRGSLSLMTTNATATEAVSAVDHMNLSSSRVTRIGSGGGDRSTDLHRLVLAREWDALRAGMGLDCAEGRDWGGGGGGGREGRH